jgi:hypothetical protein
LCFFYLHKANQSIKTRRVWKTSNNNLGLQYTFFLIQVSQTLLGAFYELGYCRLDLVCEVGFVFLDNPLTNEKENLAVAV